MTQEDIGKYLDPVAPVQAENKVSLTSLYVP